VMAMANLSGGAIRRGRMAIRHGNGFVRKVFLVAISLLACKLAWDTIPAAGVTVQAAAARGISRLPCIVTTWIPRSR